MKMSVSLSLILSLFLLIHTTHGFDITQILNKYPEYSTFNSYLTQTNLAAAINARTAITVLVVDNANLSPLSSKSLDEIKNILSVHVILDYYDVAKLQQLSTSSALLTTLFQASGLAKGQQGFLNVSHPSADSVTFGSAMPGSTQGSSLVKPVTSELYNISILQVSNAIIPQGIDGTKTSSPPTTSPPAVPPPPTTAATTAPQSSMAPPPAPSSTGATTAPQSSMTPPPPPPPPTTGATTAPQSSMAPPPSTVPPTPSQAKAPTSASPTKAPAPTKADAPSAAPGSALTPTAAAPGAPAGDAPPTILDDAPAADKPKSAATTVEIGLALVCTMALSTLHLGSRI